MIKRREIDHLDLVQLGKMLLLLFKRQELLVDLPSMSRTTEEIVPTEVSEDLLSGSVRGLGLEALKGREAVKKLPRVPIQ